MIWSCSLLKWISIHALGFYYCHQIRKISTWKNRIKILFCILKTKKWLSVVKGLSDARTKNDARMAWHGIDDDVAWSWNHCFIIDIVLEKYDKLVKIRKLAKYGNIGPSSLNRMPATICVLKKMPKTWGYCRLLFYLINYGLSLSKYTPKKNLWTCQNCGFGKLDQA